jgi:hypothetical protein
MAVKNFTDWNMKHYYSDIINAWHHFFSPSMVQGVHHEIHEIKTTIVYKVIEMLFPVQKSLNKSIVYTPFYYLRMINTWTTLMDKSHKSRQRH